MRLTPINPKFIKKGQTLFLSNGVPATVMDIKEESGKFYWYVVYQDVNNEMQYKNYEYDSHVYDDDGGDPYPELYRKNPVRKRA